MSKRKKKGFITKLFSMLVASSCILTSGCSSKEEKHVDLEITASTTQVDYTKDGDPVAPLSLVSITRKKDDDTSKKKDESDKEKADENSKKSDDSSKNDSSKSKKEADDKTPKEAKAYIEDGLEVVKVYPEVIDTSKVGEVEVFFTVKDTENDDYESQLSQTFEVVDKSAPQFKLTDKTVSISANSDFKPESYIKDDAGLTKVDAEPAEDATFDKGWYTIDSNVDTSKAGSYTVKYHAVGNGGGTTDLTLKVTVEEVTSSASADTSSKNESTSSKKNNSKANSSTKAKANANSNATATQQNNQTAADVTGGDMYNGVIQTQGCKKKTVHHDAITKETQYQEWVEDKAAWKEEYYVCNSCGQSFTTWEDASNHAEEMMDNGDTSHTWRNAVDFHPAEGHYETKTKTEIITPAYDEQVCE